MQLLELFTDHIFEKVNPAMEALGMECKCLGGGKIEHNSQEKKLRVFGESTVSLFGWKVELGNMEKIKYCKYVDIATIL